MVYKKGSTGEVVKQIQKVIGVTADGVFGSLTETVVKRWQKLNGLTADGIVGEKTLAKMGIVVNTTTTTSTTTKAPVVEVKSTNSKCIDPSVIYEPLSVHVSKLANRTIKYLAIHYTAGGSSAAGRAAQIKSVFEKRQASADFAVDDRDMVQFNPDINNYYCWAVGDKKNSSSGGGSLYGVATNRNTISIEICSNLEKGSSAAVPNHEGWTYTEASLNNAIKLAKIIMKKYNIPIERVVRHYDISGKLCPGIVGWNDSILYKKDGTKTSSKNSSLKWKEFKLKLV